MGAAPVPCVFGEVGLDSVSYTGTLRGYYRGPVTGHSYRIDPDHPVFFADRRDLAKLSLVLGLEGERLFEAA